MQIGEPVRRIFIEPLEAPVEEPEITRSEPIAQPEPELEPEPATK